MNGFFKDGRPDHALAGTIECPNCKADLRYRVEQPQKGKSLFMAARCQGGCGVGFLT